MKQRGRAVAMPWGADAKKRMPGRGLWFLFLLLLLLFLYFSFLFYLRSSQGGRYICMVDLCYACSLFPIWSTRNLKGCYLIGQLEFRSWCCLPFATLPNQNEKLAIFVIPLDLSLPLK
jgi:tryptophan-rich sensory protein